MPAAEAPARAPLPPQEWPKWNDRRIELILGNLLRAGVLFSAAIVLWGACIYLFRHAHEPADYRVFKG
jgi:hypothetical protein